MGFFDSTTENITEVEETNVQATDQSIVGGDRVSAGGGVNIREERTTNITDASPELITSIGENFREVNESFRAANASQERNTGKVINFSRDVVTGIAGAAADVVNTSFESVTDISERALDSNERSQTRALDTVASQAERSTGFLTRLTDNVLSRDAVQKIAARTEGQLNEALRAVSNVGTVGGQMNENNRNLILGGLGVAAVVAAVLIFRKK